MKKINLNQDTSIDLSKLIDSRLLVQANSGGGKSWILRRILEQSHGKVQQIIIDPEGEFATLREKYEYILCGKEADVPADSRSAALLAHRLLEFKTSAIIDLYELHPQERKHFVRLFLDSLINAPKSLWHPVIVVIDEAHTFVPEKGDSEAASSVIGLASLGRKRGFCAVLATQRISKLHKDAAAECNNKLIGRTALDIDRKRASEELGFTSKEQSLSLRTLEPGSFFGFGPAISNEVIEIKVGKVDTTHPKAGSRRSVRLAPPTEAIKEVLSKLSDLPAEAAKEAQTVAELKAELKQVKSQNTQLLKNPFQKDIDPEDLKVLVEEKLKNHIIAFETVENAYKIKINQFEEFIGNIRDTVNNFTLAMRELGNREPKKDVGVTYQKPIFAHPIYKSKTREIKVSEQISPGEIVKIEGFEQNFGRCSKAIYSYLSLHVNDLVSKTKVAVAVGYSQNSGGFNNSISELSSAGLIRRHTGGLSFVNSQVRQDLIINIDISLEKWANKLGACARAIWQHLLDGPSREQEWSKDHIAERTGYSVTSGGFNNSISELSALGLIERMSGGMIRINPEILNI